MSGKLMGQVFSLVLTRPQREVLLAIADHARDDGSGAFPSVGRLAWKVDLTERQVKRILKQLRDMGILIPIRYGKGGRGHATHYQLNLFAGIPKPEYQRRSAKGDMYTSPFTISKDVNSSSERVTPNSLKCDTSSEKGDAQMSPQPSVEKPSSLEPPTTNDTVQRAVVVVGESKFTLEQCQIYAQHLHKTMQGVKYPSGFARSIYKSGQEDKLMDIYFGSPKGARLKDSEPSCQICFGTGMEHIFDDNGDVIGVKPGSSCKCLKESAESVLAKIESYESQVSLG